MPHSRSIRPLACGLCAVACPADAIYLEAAENDGTVMAGPRYAITYQIHKMRCIYCGMCEEACPYDAITMGPRYDLADDHPDKFIAVKEDLLEPLSASISDTAVPSGAPSACRARSSASATSRWPRVLSARALRAAPMKPLEGAKRSGPSRSTRPVRLSFKEAQELEGLPARIEALEREQADLGRRLGDADLYRSDPESVKTATARHAEIEELLLQLLARWEDLEGKRGGTSSSAQ